MPGFVFDFSPTFHHWGPAEVIELTDDGSNLPAEPTATAESLEPDDPIFVLAGEVNDRLRSDLAPGEALLRGVRTTAEFLQSCGLADDSLPAWGWVLEPVFDLPVGWSTTGADPEGASLAREAFAENCAATVITVPAATTFLALPVVGHDEAGEQSVGAMIAVPLVADAQPDDNVLVGAMTGAGIVGVQMENSMRARAASRSLQFAQAASRTQLALVDPTDLVPALREAIAELANCEELRWGLAQVQVGDAERVVAEFGERASGEVDGGASLSEPELAELRAAMQLELPVTIDGVREATIVVHTRHTPGIVERDTIGSVATAVAGSAVRHRAALTIEELRRSATRRLVEAQERERSMIAADIHDGVLQQLGATAIRLELAQSRVEQHDFDAASSIIADGAKEIRSCARELRSLLMELRPQVLDDNGLNAALSELGRHVQGTKVLVESNIPEELGSEFAITIFRIVQEALTNIEKHSQAKRATVHVALDSGAIRIDVVDDGVGFEGAVSGPSAEGSHLGLLGMRERAQMFGGSFSITGASGGGTAIHAILPLERPTGDAEPDERPDGAENN